MYNLPGTSCQQKVQFVSKLGRGMDTTLPCAQQIVFHPWKTERFLHPTPRLSFLYPSKKEAWPHSWKTHSRQAKALEGYVEGGWVKGVVWGDGVVCWGAESKENPEGWIETPEELHVQACGFSLLPYNRHWLQGVEAIWAPSIIYFF